VAGRMFGLKRLLHACGIVAFVGDEPATPYLLEGLQSSKTAAMTAQASRR